MEADWTMYCLAAYIEDVPDQTYRLPLKYAISLIRPSLFEAKIFTYR
jgi:hypothetical protein